MNKLLRFMLMVACAAGLHAFAPKAHAAPYLCPNPMVAMMTPPGTIVVDSTVANGTVLWTGTINVGSSGINTCTGPWPAANQIIDFVGDGVYDGGNVYESGIPGIGYKVSANLCYSGYWPGSCSSSWSAGTVAAHTLSVRLVKTGPIQSGTMSGNFAHWILHQDQYNTSYPNQTYLIYQWAGSFIIKPKSPACTVSTPNIAVPMGDVPATAFTGPGSTSATKDFSIQLACSGGDPGTATKVAVTLTDATNPGNVSTTLSLTKASTAQGVGMQVLFNDTAISYGPDSSAIGNTNQWQAGSVSQGTSTFSIPLKARYVQTGSSVSAGSATAVATFTMSYQ